MQALSCKRCVTFHVERIVCRAASKTKHLDCFLANFASANALLMGQLPSEHVGVLNTAHLVGA